MSKFFTIEEVAKHNKEGDAWIIIDGQVWDITKFAKVHPGGYKIIMEAAGQDATQLFHNHHDKDLIYKYQNKFVIGQVKDFQIIPFTRQELSENEYGELLPNCDPYWYQGQYSPYYGESHKAFRNKVRYFIETEVLPYSSQWNKEVDIPRELDLKIAQLGIMNAILGPPFNTEYYKGEPIKNFDHFFHIIIISEFTRSQCGPLGSLMVGNSVALPPIYHFGSDYLKNWIIPEIVYGRKRMALAISEPWVGSDVAQMRTVAKKEGDYFVINGAKKWITNGATADFFTVAARTGQPGQKGISMFLVEKNTPGFTMRRLESQSGESVMYLIFEDVKVPIKNMIGDENSGFMQIMYNFNPERLTIVVQAIQLARTAYEYSLKWSLSRETFGKALHNHQSIRMKLAHMARQIESTQAWMEQIVYQMTKMEHFEAMAKLGASMALLKAHATKTAEACVRDAMHIFGGAGLVKSGPGEKVEQMYRTAQTLSIPGGAEDILIDFGARTIIKKAQQQLKSQQKQVRAKL